MSRQEMDRKQDGRADGDLHPSALELLEIADVREGDGDRAPGPVRRVNDSTRQPFPHARAHVRVCPTCQARIAALREQQQAMADAMRALYDAPLSADETERATAFAENLMARAVSVEATADPRAASPRRTARQFLIRAAPVGLAAGLVFAFLRRDTGDIPRGESQAVPSRDRAAPASTTNTNRLPTGGSPHQDTKPAAKGTAREVAKPNAPGIDRHRGVSPLPEPDATSPITQEELGPLLLELETALTRKDKPSILRLYPAFADSAFRAPGSAFPDSVGMRIVATLGQGTSTSELEVVVRLTTVTQATDHSTRQTRDMLVRFLRNPAGRVIVTQMKPW